MRIRIGLLRPAIILVLATLGWWTAMFWPQNTEERERIARETQMSSDLKYGWGQMKKEFVSQARHKGGLEEMRERLGHWVNWYNFQRFQTEIKCAPAEGFFQYQAAMKAEIERRILASEKEQALGMAMIGIPSWSRW